MIGCLLARRWFAAVVAVVAVLPPSVRAQELVSGLPDGEPRAVLASPAGGFVLVYDSRLVTWREGALETVIAAPPRPGYRFEKIIAAVAPDGTVHALARARTAGGEHDDVWSYRCAAKGCDVEVRFTGGDDSSLLLDRAAVDRDGAPHFATRWAHTVHEKGAEGGGESMKVVDRVTARATERWYDGTGAFVDRPDSQERRLPPDFLAYDRENRPVVVTNMVDELRVERVRPDLSRELVATIGPQMYNFDAALRDDGRLEVLYHDPSTKALVLATVDLAEGTVTRDVVEGPEAGIECAVLGRDDAGQLVGVSYFYRNAFYKGLKVVRGRQGDWRTVDVDASPERNLGWKLRAARGGDGSVLVSYLDDVLEHRRVTRWYRSLDQLWESGRAEPTGWESRPQVARVLAGGGGTYAWWGLGSFRPFDSAARAASWKVDYDLAASRLGRVFLEGEVGHLKLGASWLHDIVGDEIEQTPGGAVAKRGFDLVTAVVGWDQLFLYQDVQARVEWGSVRGVMRAEGPTSFTQPFESPRRRIEADFLSAFRTKVVLAYEYFRAPFAAYEYGVPSGEKAYQFLGSVLTDASFNDLSFAVGYSMLDYTSKYEVSVSRPFVDAQLGLGASLVTLDESVPVPEGWDSRKHDLMWFWGGELEVGWLVQRRSYALHGLGLFARAGVRARGMWYFGGSEKPGDEDEAASSDKTALRLSRTQGFVGPYVDLGIVF